ncbi:SSI family serine proteinase inhibitor [Streptomyces sp. NBC_01006]|uniref:SSI family serine proteinase inhibitor n=1 Tax=Streptomyces sp. NBC_01006 TaxID=2903716 RepID=UPI00386BA0E1|nr:subtilase-type protease inhibitor [Streptomyces sp. NBC_01006]
MLRLAAFAVTSALAASAATAAGPLPPLTPLSRLLATPDRLTITVSATGNPRANGEYLLECNPVGGNHPEAERACDRLDALAKQDKYPFAPAAKREICTMQDGGPATAHITGTWQGHRVDATFQRTNGCEITRWNNLEPVLPGGRS